MTQMPPLPDLETTEPDAVVDGRRVFFAWHADGQITEPLIPVGALVEHYDGHGKSCISWLPWADAGDGGPYWSLVSLRPFTIAEPFVCSRCGAFGSIRDNHWFLGLPR